MRQALRRFVSDRHGRVVVVQLPNLPLIAWAVFALVARFADGSWSGYFDFLSGAALVTWAYLEITQGDSPFRRALGAAVLLGLVVLRWPG